MMIVTPSTSKNKMTKPIIITINIEGVITMDNLVFNKSVTTKRQSNKPSVIFRKLLKVGNNDRYQGSLNSNAVKLIETINSEFTCVDIVFSDEHSMIGLKPVIGKGINRTFGATQLFRELNLVTGKHYTLTINGDLSVIDSDEFEEL